MTVDERIAEIEALGQAVRVAAEVCANASFDCGEWSVEHDDQSYEDVFAVSRNARVAFEAALSAVLESLRSARKDSERLDWMERGRLTPRPRLFRDSWVFGMDEEIECPTLRETTDAAMVGSVLPELEQG